MATINRESTKPYKTRNMITKNYVDFFQGLEKNNKKEWFHKNKKSYEEAKNSFLSLLDSFIPELIQLDPTISPIAKNALFRIKMRLAHGKNYYREATLKVL